MHVAAGIILYKNTEGIFGTGYKYLLVHMGGPFWRKKDHGAWSIPKGETEPGEELIQVAKREFTEETGLQIPENLVYVGQIKYKSGKVVHAYSGYAPNLPDQPEIKSNTIEIEWPPKSGKHLTTPEVDRAQFFTLEEAKERIIPAQFELLEILEKSLILNPANS